MHKGQIHFMLLVLLFKEVQLNVPFAYSSEGFTERIAAGTFEISADIKNPSPINCRTCHKIHKTYTSSDWALTTDAPVILQLTGDTFDEG